MSIYHKYAPGGSKFILLYYIYDCLYLYVHEKFGKWFVDKLGKRFHVNFLGYAYWFMYIMISHLEDNYISVDQARYATYVLAKYLDTATIN